MGRVAPLSVTSAIIRSGSSEVDAMLKQLGILIAFLTTFLIGVVASA